jgi:hypothetical protein
MRIEAFVEQVKEFFEGKRKANMQKMAINF